MFFSLQYSTNAEEILSALAFFKGTINFNDVFFWYTLSTQRQQIVSYSIVVISLHSSAMMLKWVPWSRLSRDSSTHVPRAFTNSTTAIFEVYVAFHPALSKKVWRVSPPQLTTNSTSLSKFVVCAMCWWARKWVHQIRGLIDFLFCNLCCSPTFWSWLIRDPSFLALSASMSNWQDRRCTSLFNVISFFESPSSN